MSGPFALLAHPVWRRILIGMTAATLLLLVWLVLLNRPLMNPASPLGLWSLATERDGYGARTIIDNWELLRPLPAPVNNASGIIQPSPPSPVDEAIALTQLRFVFVFVSGFTLSLACLWAGVRSGATFAGLGLSAAAWGAALLHAAENMALLRMLLTRNPGDGEATLASTAFAARLALTAVLLVWLYRTLRRRPAVS